MLFVRLVPGLDYAEPSDATLRTLARLGFQTQTRRGTFRLKNRQRTFTVTRNGSTESQTITPDNEAKLAGGTYVIRRKLNWWFGPVDGWPCIGRPITITVAQS